MADAEKSTAETIQEFKQGRNPKENFERLWYRYYRRVYHYFQNRKLVPDQCKELTQDVFIAVYTGLKGLQQEEKFEVWLLKIAVNRFNTYWQQWQRNKNIVLLDPEVHGEPVEPGPDPEARLLDEEKRRRFKSAWQELPEQQRDCLKWHYYDNRSYKEIAEIKRIGVETVKSHLKQGRKALKRKLGSDFLDDWNKEV